MKLILRKVNKIYTFIKYGDMMDKKGLSEMIGYVILISIAIGLAVGVYAFWQLVINGTGPAIDCPEGTSVILDSYTCADNIITLGIRNNGRFDVQGVVVSVGNDSQKVPVTYLLPVGPGNPGHYSFLNKLSPNEIKEAKFKNETDKGVYNDGIKIIEIQPFIINKTKIMCRGGAIKEEINC